VEAIEMEYPLLVEKYSLVPDSGASGRFLIRDTSGETRRLHDKSGEVVMQAHQAIIVETPGDGGHGPPEELDVERVIQDGNSDKISQDHRDKHYGHVQG
jgi:N-methylhydantoinase B/oxoprolinase/acetone carboxylase alpha subunit